MRLDVIPGVLESRVGELLGLALDLLHRQHVDALPHGEIDDAVDASADRVDVPGGQAHGIKPRSHLRRRFATLADSFTASPAPQAAAPREADEGPHYSSRRMSSTRSFASPKSMAVFSRKNSGFCTPA